MTLRPILFACALATAGFASAGPASAGFFESLFGSPAAPPAASAPAEISVAPSRPRAYRSQPSVQHSAHQRLGNRPTQKMASIDPQQDQDWFLHDPALRSGDVVILAKGAFVFSSKSRSLPHTMSDFVALDKSILISDASRNEIKMIGPRADQIASTISDSSGKVAALAN